jgi:signal transduction histidine kinase
MLSAPRETIAESSPAERQQSLTRAFTSFAKAAGSLERSYLQLETEVCRLRCQLEQANSELEQEREKHRRAQALAEISTLLAHEIRNPLGSLELFAGLLAQSNLPEEPRSWVQHLRAGLRTLSATVNNVLHLHSEPHPQLSRIEVNALLQSASEFLGPLAEQRGVRIELEGGIASPLYVRADGNQIQQVLLNLALNAFHFLPERGVVRFSASQQAEGVRVTVSDNGPGIASEDLPYLFEAGFSRRPGSAGLGLAVCKKVMEQHAGSIHVASVEGKGATFSLCFPPAEGVR